MPITVEMLNAEPIIQATFHEPFDPAADMPPMLAKIKTLRQQAEQQVVVILDTSQIQLEFTQMVLALSAARQQIRQELEAGARMPAQYLFVGESANVKIAAQAMGQEQYGGIRGQIFTSQEAAMERARSIIQESLQGP